MAPTTLWPFTPQVNETLAVQIDKMRATMTRYTASYPVNAQASVPSELRALESPNDELESLDLGLRLGRL